MQQTINGVTIVRKQTRHGTTLIISHEPDCPIALANSFNFLVARRNDIVDAFNKTQELLDSVEQVITNPSTYRHHNKNMTAYIQAGNKGEQKDTMELLLSLINSRTEYSKKIDTLIEKLDAIDKQIIEVSRKLGIPTPKFIEQGTVSTR